jgi:carbon monoxide dehydrogenase subunit G
MELDHDFTIPVPVGRAWPMLLDVERVAPCVPGATLDSIDGDELIGRLKVKLGAMTITYKGAARIVTADESTRTVTIEGSAKEARGSGTASVTVQARLSAPTAESTQVSVHTKLNVTGRPAQFGRNILSEVGGKLIARFAKALSEELAAGSPSATMQAPVEPPPERQAVSPDDAAASASEVVDARVAESAGAETAAPTVSPAATGPARPDGIASPAGADTARPATRRASRPGEEAIDLLEVAGPSVAKRVAPVMAGMVAALTIWQVFRRRRGRHHR